MSSFAMSSFAMSSLSALPSDLTSSVAEHLSYRELLDLFLANPSLRHTVPLTRRQSLEAALACASWCVKAGKDLDYVEGHSAIKERVNTFLRPRFGPRTSSCRAAIGVLSRVRLTGGAYLRKDGVRCVESPILYVVDDGIRATFYPSWESQTYVIQATPSIIVELTRSVIDRTWTVITCHKLPSMPKADTDIDIIKEAARVTAANISLVPRFDPDIVSCVSVKIHGACAGLRRSYVASDLYVSDVVTDAFREAGVTA